jgi:hypothetical protein
MTTQGFSQIELPKQKVDSSGLILSLTPNFTYHFVMADLRKEFGNNLSIGTDICLKTKSNWTIDFGFKYYFKDKKAVRDDIIDYTFQLITTKLPDGTSIFVAAGGNASGGIQVGFRGISFHLQAGKVIPVVQKFQNSGILLKAGIGVMQHYLYIKNPPSYDQDHVPALTAEYRKGYDRLTLGFSLNQFVGYMHLTKKNLLCFYGGVEFYQIFAHRQREYDFNLMRKDDAKLFESLIGLKVGWIIPLYKHNPYAEFEYR